MIALVGIGPRRSGLGDEEFAARWAGGHAAIVRDLPGLRGYVQHHAPPGRPHPGFDCFSELFFDDLERMKAAFRSDVYRNRVAPDEEELVERSRLTGFRGEVVADDAGDPAAAVVCLYRAEPRGRPPRSRRLRGLPGDRSGITAIDVVAYGSLEAALSGLNEAAPEASLTMFASRPLRVV